MPMKIRKAKSRNQLLVERIHHAKNYKLAVDRTLCVGCELCSRICPKEAIRVDRQPKKKGGKAQRAQTDIDETKCHYCGICAAICPYGAVQITIDGENITSVVEKESFPELIRELAVDTNLCPINCTECEKACPLDLIKVTSDSNKKVTVKIKEEQCPCCRVCETKCPEDAIRVRRIFTGKLRIDKEKCPEGCRDCLDVCPITGALYTLEKDDKVHVNETICVFCGACKTVCPEEGALELSRSTIYHTSVRSGAWNKALEKLASTTDMTKELRGKGKTKTMEAVKKRFEKKEE